MLEKKPKDFFRNQIHPYFKSIEKSALSVLKLPAKKGRPFNPFAYVNRQFNKKVPAHPGAIDEILMQLLKHWDKIEQPWSYANAILKTINGNWCERDHIDRHESVKKEFAVFIDKSEELRHLLRNIGR